MRKSLFTVLGSAAVLGTALLTTTAASAAPQARAAPAANCSTTPGVAGTDCDTTVTFTVTAGGLTMTAPAAASLSDAAPGGHATGAAGAVVVTDLRALLGGTWTAVASSTDFTTGTLPTQPETIPAGDATYNPGTPATTGSFNATPYLITLDNAPIGTAGDVVTSTGNGNNSATWNPAIDVTVPAAAVRGTYTGTLTQSVS